jgi:adhesin transport system outer membrane protein
MRLLTPLCSAVLLAMACTSQAQAMSLTEAIQSTIATHPELASRVDSRLSADEDVKVAKGGFYPSVDLNAAYGRGYSDNTNTRAFGNHHTRNHQLHPVGTAPAADAVRRFQHRQRSRAHQRRGQLPRLLRQGTAQDLALRTIEVYLEVLKRRELVTLAKNNLQAHLRVNDQIGLRTERGIGSTADADQSTARRALAENNLDTAEVDLADAESNFYAWSDACPMNWKPRPRLAAKCRRIAGSPAEHGRQQPVPEIRPGRRAIGREPVRSRQVTVLPTLRRRSRGGCEQQHPGDEGHDNEWRVGMVMNYNLFRGGSDKARLQSDAHKINQAMDIRNNALRQLNENIHLAWNAMVNAKKQTPTAREYADTSKRVRVAYQDQFGLGQRTLLDLLDSENELYNANRRYTEMRYTEEFSMYRVLANMGQLLSKQRVVLPADAIAQRSPKPACPS